MKALTLIPGTPGSLALREVPEPAASEGELLCELRAVGVCGTDMEISRGLYGSAPKGSPYLILGHESLGRVLEAPAGARFKVGDWVVGFVRRPDPVPCPSCAAGEWDMCQNGLFQERGISGLHGFASERYRVPQEYVIALPPQLAEVGALLEPTSVVAKAWEQSLRIASRGHVPPRRALITGAGPVGLLAAMIGKQRGLEMHVLDQALDGPKPELVRALGATYHTDLKSVGATGADFDLTIECTGAPALVFELINHIKPNGILCLAGLSSGTHEFPTNIAALNQGIVLQNEVIFGSVNANRRHYEAAAAALTEADPAWLARLITRRVPFAQWQNAFEKGPSDIKVVLVPR